MNCRELPFCFPGAAGIYSHRDSSGPGVKRLVGGVGGKDENGRIDILGCGDAVNEPFLCTAWVVAGLRCLVRFHQLLSAELLHQSIILLCLSVGGGRAV